MDVDPMMFKVLRIPYAMVGESSFPNLHRVSQSLSYGMRVPTFDELHRTFKRDFLRCHQHMKMLGHKHKGVKVELSLAPIRVEDLQEEPRHWFGYEKASSLPGYRSYEICPLR